MIPKSQILIVEDEIITALELGSRLERLGYGVCATATSAEEAIDQLASSQPDLVLMDIRLKGDMDGIQAAESIRAHYGTPVVYLTAYADAETLERAKATEPYGYLLKPFEEREIHTTIEMALYKYQMEKKVRESQQWLDMTLRSIGDAVIAVDSAGCVEFVNPVAESLTGWRQAEALGRHVTDVLNIVSEPADTPVENPTMRALRQNRTVMLEDHCILMARDGSRVPIGDSAAPMRDTAGEVMGAVTVFRDLTERTQAEAARQQYARELEARNGELDAFAHTVAHDLKNPLNLIIGYCGLLKDDHRTMTPEELDESLSAAVHSGIKMNNIIDELLLLAEVRKHQVQIMPLDMGYLVDAACMRLIQMVEKHHAQVIGPETWPSAMGYAPWIEEVWVNYLSNAIKYGGRPPYIEVGAVEQGDTIRFWVRDNGPGVAPGERARLFTPFTRLDQARAEGHGLGLSVVQRIMDKLNGRAGLESDGVPGQGSLFYFDLPRTGAQVAAE
jgi:PAS domain S-box-containing protein